MKNFLIITAAWNKYQTNSADQYAIEIKGIISSVSIFNYSINLRALTFMVSYLTVSVGMTMILLDIQCN